MSRQGRLASSLSRTRRPHFPLNRGRSATEIGGTDDNRDRHVSRYSGTLAIWQSDGVSGQKRGKERDARLDLVEQRAVARRAKPSAGRDAELLNVKPGGAMACRGKRPEAPDSAPRRSPRKAGHRQTRGGSAHREARRARRERRRAGFVRSWRGRAGTPKAEWCFGVMGDHQPRFFRRRLRGHHASCDGRLPGPSPPRA